MSARLRQSKLADLLAFDAALLTETPQYSHIIGADEVGRGSIIGPVIAAAFTFTRELTAQEQTLLTDLDDSKASHLTHEKRVALAQTLKNVGAWGFGEATQREVETLNVSKASLLASHRAALALSNAFPQITPQRSLLVLDGKMRLPGYTYGQKAIIKADSKSASVAAASIIAKAYRDSLVQSWASEYPGYGWENNAGYPTPAHKAALETLGVTPLHRKTYASVRNVMKVQQACLFPDHIKL